MKKVITILSLLIVFTASIIKADSMSFEDAIVQQKPMAVLIYANWADDAKAVLNAYDNMSAAFGERYNFTKVNIATEEAKGFNKMYHIYPNLPYVLLFKDKGKISRYLKKDCIQDNACFKERLEFFLN